MGRADRGNDTLVIPGGEEDEACGEHITSDDRSFHVQTTEETENATLESGAEIHNQVPEDKQAERDENAAYEEYLNSLQYLEEIEAKLSEAATTVDMVGAFNEAFEGGSFSQAAYNEILFQCTKRRTLELVSVYFNNSSDFSFDLNLEDDQPEIQQDGIEELLEQQADEIYRTWKRGPQQYKTDNLPVKRNSRLLCKASFQTIGNKTQTKRNERSLSRKNT